MERGRADNWDQKTKAQKSQSVEEHFRQLEPLLEQYLPKDGEQITVLPLSDWVENATPALTFQPPKNNPTTHDRNSASLKTPGQAVTYADYKRAKYGSEAGPSNPGPSGTRDLNSKFEKMQSSYSGGGRQDQSRGNYGDKPSGSGYQNRGPGQSSSSGYGSQHNGGHRGGSGQSGSGYGSQQRDQRGGSGSGYGSQQRDQRGGSGSGYGSQQRDRRGGSGSGSQQRNDGYRGRGRH